MESKYGFLKGVCDFETHGNGKLKSCILSEKNILDTEYGELVPQYNDDHERRKLKPSLCFYEDGSLERVYLQEIKKIKTAVGTIPAESILFHENGEVKRIFPLDGKLNGFWTEKKEYDLSEKIKIETPLGVIEEKIIGIAFYKSGKVRSITFWPGDLVNVNTPVGVMNARTGLSFYESGALKSFEPGSNIKINTPIGKLQAYNISPLGIHGDTNSLTFCEEGKIKSLYTSTDEIVVETNGETYKYSPGSKVAACSDTLKEIVPLKIMFLKDGVSFNDTATTHTLEGSSFQVKNPKTDIKNMTVSCH